MSVAGIRVMPTRGFLLDFKRRVKAIEDGYKLLEMKRDELTNKLRAFLEELKAAKRSVLEDASKIMAEFSKVYSLVGPDVIDSFARSIGRIEAKVLPMSIMGIVVPEVKFTDVPQVKNKYPPVVRSIAEKLYELLEDLMKITVLETKIEIIAYDLERTNRTVNALEKIVIPEMKKIIKMVEDVLDEDELEEFTRLKIVRDKVIRRE